MDGESEDAMAVVEQQDWLPESEVIGGRHVLAATLAAVFSIAAHGLLAFVASRVDMDFFSRLAYQVPPREYPAMKLGSVELSDAVQTRVLTALRELGQAVPPDVTAALDEMQVAPEVGITDPPALAELVETPLELAGVSEPELAPPGDAWMPRQEILAVEIVAVGGELAGLERRVIPDIERVPGAPDIVLPASMDLAGTVPQGAFPLKAPSASRSLREAIGDPAPAAVTEQAPVIAAVEEDRERFEETPEEITDIEPVERVLKARVDTFTDRRDRDYAYFRLVIERAGEEVLPVRPKDVLLVQDASASMAEQRLHFSREAMRRALAAIGPADRFNVASFADRTAFCFPGWVTKTPETLAQAEIFINAMVSAGNTDLFASMLDLLAVERQPERPVVAFVLTDGLVNKGLTDSTEIIAAFTRQNLGQVSIFTMGVSAQANRYLIDLLSYCNGGGAEVIESGRWDIPVAAEAVMRGIQRPVLSDLTLRFGADSTVEVYPRRLGNLYLDRPLVLYGRFRHKEPKLVFQALGQAGQTRCDMIFDLPLNAAAAGVTSGDAAIRESWAQQKIYHLLGEYARSRDREILGDLRKTGRDYDVTVPYRRVLGF